MDRHPILRTTFSDNNGVPVQHLHKHMQAYFQETDASSWNEEVLEGKSHKAYLRPFDLNIGPLLRVHLFTRSEQDHVFLIVAHHIVLDGWSLWLLLDEMRSLYASKLNGKPLSLPAPEAEYSDYVSWQSELIAGPKGESTGHTGKNSLRGS